MYSMTLESGTSGLDHLRQCAVLPAALSGLAACRAAYLTTPCNSRIGTWCRPLAASASACRRFCSPSSWCNALEAVPRPARWSGRCTSHRAGVDAALAGAVSQLHHAPNIDERDEPRQAANQVQRARIDDAGVGVLLRFHRIIGFSQPSLMELRRAHDRRAHDRHANGRRATGRPANRKLIAGLLIMTAGSSPSLGIGAAV